MRTRLRHALVPVALAAAILLLAGAGTTEALARTPVAPAASSALTAENSPSMTAATSSYLCRGYAACATAGYPNAGYAAVAKSQFWLMYGGHNCTNYAAYRMVHAGMANVRPWSGTGNAYNWGPANASRTNATPAVGAVAWWKANVTGAGSVGHVAYVEQVVSSTEIVISEDNWGGNFDWRRVKKSSGWPSGFIHFADATNGSPIGHLDRATSPKAHLLSLTGWAYDPDLVSRYVYLRVYVGPLSGPRQRLDFDAARLSRPDVATAHPGAGPDHGFNQTEAVTASGSQLVSVYALNKSTTPGKAKLLYQKNVTIRS
jgi:surface antigen